MGAALTRCGAVMAAALALSGCAASAAPSPTAPVDLGDPAVFARALFDETNTAREAQELAPLEWSACLADAALPRAQAQLGTAPLSHAPLPSPCTPGVTAGENLSRTWHSADEVVGLWMDSETHRANLLNPAFTASGITCVPYAFDDPSVAAAGDNQGGMACSQLFEGS